MKQNEFQKIAVAGSGKMGSEIFFLLLHQTPSMVWLCESEEEASAAEGRFLKKVSRLARIGIHDADAEKKLAGRVKVTADKNMAADSDLLLECIPENKSLKKDFFAAMDEICKPECVFCSNSSSILPSRMIPSPSRAGLMAGTHFFYPVSMKKVTELVLHNGTGSETADRLHRFLKQLGFHVLLQNESQAFRLNRILLELQVHLSELRRSRGFSCHKIDVVINERLIPGGVFGVMDQIGFDVLSASIRNYMQIDANTGAGPLLEEIENMMSEGRLGRKSGGGYYTAEADTADSPTEEEEKLIFTESLHVLRKAVSKSMTGGDEERNSLELALREYFGLERADIFFE